MQVVRYRNANTNREHTLCADHEGSVPGGSSLMVQHGTHEGTCDVCSTQSRSEGLIAIVCEGAVYCAQHSEYTQEDLDQAHVQEITDQCYLLREYESLLDHSCCSVCGVTWDTFGRVVITD